MRKIYFLLVIIIATYSVKGQVTLAGWDVSTLLGGSNNFGPSPFAATTTNSNVNVGSIIRGSGVSTTGTAAARGWGGLGWNNTTAALNIAANKFFTFTVQANTNYSLSLSSINPFDYRRSSSGPPSVLVQYDKDGGGFLDITTLTLSSTSSSGASAGPVDLTGITALQNLTSSNVITFRFVPFNASGATGTFYIYDVANNTSNDLSLNGTVTLNTSNSNTSDIIFNTGFTTPTNVNYAAYQATDLTDANSLEVAQFTIRDGGASAPDGDALGTTLTALTLSLSNSSNIRRVALYDGTTELAEVAGGASPNFTGLTLAAADDGSKTFSIRVSFNASVTDNQQYQFSVTSATADIGGSVFAAGNAGGASSSTSGDDNRIEVTADRLAFIQNTTSPTALNVAMAPAPTISANDANGNRDLDVTANIDITSTGTLSTSPVTVAAASGLATFTGNIIHTVAGTGLQLTAASAGLTSATSNLFDIQVASSATDYFRSAVASGNWGTAASWESSPDNSTWNPSTLVPDANANTITIRNGHNITVAAATSADQVVVEAGATLTLNANFTLANGADAVDMTVNGTLVNAAGSHTVSGVISQAANSLHQHNRNAGVILTATWAPTSTLEVTGITSGSSFTSGLSQSFGNFIWNSPSQAGSFNLSGDLLTVNGNLRVQNSGAGQLRLTGSSTMSLTIAGNFVVEDDLNIDSDAAGTTSIGVGGNFSHIAGAFQSASDVVTITMTGSPASITQSGGTYTGTNINWVINTGASVTLLNALAISASRSITVDGVLIAAATLTNNGNTSINNVFQINEGGWGTGTGFVYGASATLVFNNTTNYGVNGDAYWPTSNGPVNVTVQNTGGITMNVARTVTGLFQTSAGVLNGNNLTLNGTAQLNTGGYFTNAPVYGASSLLKYNTGGTYNRGDEWNATGVGTIGTTNGYPNNVQVSNNTTINLPNGSGVDRACERDLIIDNGSSLYADYGGGSVKLFVGRNFDMSGNVSLGTNVGGDMYVRGNFTRNAGTFNPNGRTVFFDGASGDQTITGATTFDWITINKAAGNVVLANSISCNFTLTLTNGKIVLGNNDLTINDGADYSISGGSATSYIVTNGTGMLRRLVGFAYTGTDFDFPVGSAANRQLVKLNFNSLSSSNTVSARFITGSPVGTAGLPLSESGNTIQRAANNGYWEISNSAVTGDLYTGTFYATGFTDITDYTKVHLIKRADAVSNWVLNGTHVTTTGANLAAVLQRTGMSGFSQFAVGGQSNLSLPVTLLSFSGYKDGSRNQLSWTTGTEINNRGFDVQRSTDGVNYTSIGFVNSLATGGNSNDRLSYRFTDNTVSGVKQYYRLRQEDLDGRSKLSNIVLINGAKPSVIALRSIFPNPAQAAANIIIDAPAAAKLTLLLTDMAGRNVTQQLVTVSEGSNTVTVNIASLQSGTYLVRVINELGEVVTGKLVKE